MAILKELSSSAHILWRSQCKFTLIIYVLFGPKTKKWMILSTINL